MQISVGTGFFNAECFSVKAFLCGFYLHVHSVNGIIDLQVAV